MTDESRSSNILTPEENPDHPLAVAARAGFGPLSLLSKEAWHGDSTPCSSCGQLNPRSATLCGSCHQDLSQPMLQKMAENSGPWFVYDNLRPIPGISLERVLLQIKRGLINRTTIIRGPTTYYQWRFATETPLVARHLGRCWNCQEKLIRTDERYCPKCKAVLNGHFRPGQFDIPDSKPTEPPPTAYPADQVVAPVPELQQAFQEIGLPTDVKHAARTRDSSPGKAPLILFGIAVVVVLLMVAFTRVGGGGSSSTTNSNSPSSPASMVKPAVNPSGGGP